MRLLAVLCLLIASLSGAHARPADPPALIFAFQPQKDPAKIKASADQVAAYLSKALGKPVEVLVPGAYAATVQALVSQRVDIAYVSSLPFLLARRDGGAKLLLAERRTVAAGKPRTDYDSIFVVPADSPLKSFDDLKRQAKSQRMVFTSPTSTSGYVFPYWRLIREGLLKPKQPAEAAFAQASYAGGYTQALEQLIAGRADVAAVSDYTMEGPKADVYLPADKRARLRILARTPGVPTHLIAARKGLSPALERKVTAALLKLSQEQPQLLAEVYGAAGLVRVSERGHVANTVAAIRATGLPIQGLVK